MGQGLEDFPGRYHYQQTGVNSRVPTLRFQNTSKRMSTSSNWLVFGDGSTTTFSVSGGSECSMIGGAGGLRQLYFLRGDPTMQKRGRPRSGGGVC